jgi:hypothetical protein
MRGGVICDHAKIYVITNIEKSAPATKNHGVCGGGRVDKSVFYGTQGAAFARAHGAGPPNKSEGTNG